MKPDRIVNLTGHTLSLEAGSETIPLPSTSRARMRSKMEAYDFVEVGNWAVPLLRITEQEIVGLPEMANGVLYIVSGIVAAAIDREDVVTPGRLRRENNRGRVRAARALVRIERKK